MGPWVLWSINTIRTVSINRLETFSLAWGPIFSGIGWLILGMYLLVPESYTTFTKQIHQRISFENVDLTVLKAIGESVIAIWSSLFTVHNLINPLFWIFLAVAIGISSHIALRVPIWKDLQKELG